MNVTKFLSADRLRATSDLDEKLPTIWSEFAVTPRCALLGTSIVLIHRPCGVSWSSTIFEVMPKLPSISALLKNRRIGAAGRRLHARRANAIRRQHGDPGDDVVRIVVIDHLAEPKIARPKIAVIVIGEGHRTIGKAGQQQHDGQARL